MEKLREVPCGRGKGLKLEEWRVPGGVISDDGIRAAAAAGADANVCKERNSSSLSREHSEGGNKTKPTELGLSS